MVRKSDCHHHCGLWVGCRLDVGGGLYVVCCGGSKEKSLLDFGFWYLLVDIFGSKKVFVSLLECALILILDQKGFCIF